MGCVKNLQRVEEEVKTISEKYGLVNVAKILVVTKYVNSDKIKEVHSFNPKYHFGENYVDSLLEKANTLPKSIKWHFIGHLQSNKCKYLARIENLYMIETVDSLKLALKLNNALKKIKEEKEETLNLKGNKEEQADRTEKLESAKEVKNNAYTKKDGMVPKKIRVLVQVKTTSDENKTGLIHTEYEEIENVILYIIEKCEHLKFKGLMTMSSLNDHEKENAFIILNEIKKKLLENPTINSCFINKKFIMSMGMSGDMEFAIKHHSTQLRIGSAIFK